MITSSKAYTRWKEPDASDQEPEAAIECCAGQHWRIAPAASMAHLSLRDRLRRHRWDLPGATAPPIRFSVAVDADQCATRLTLRYLFERYAIAEQGGGGPGAEESTEFFPRIAVR